MALELSAALEEQIRALAAHRQRDVETVLRDLLQAQETQGANTPGTASLAEQSRSQYAHDLHALHLSQAQLQGILNSQVDLVCRYTPDTILTYVNDAYCKHFGKRREELLGQSVFLFGPEEQYGAVYDRIHEIMYHPEPDVRVFKTSLPSGEENWIQWVDFGVLDEFENVVEIQAVGRDVTALIQTQRILEEQTELLQSVIDHIPVMVVVFAPDGHVELVNQRWVQHIGWTLNEMRHQRSMLNMLYPDPVLRQQVLEHMSQRAPSWHDFEITTRDGHGIEAAWASVHLSDGRMIWIGKEIAQRKALEMQRLYAETLEIELRKERELMELRGRIISTISHEFRTPLAVILTSIDLLQRYLTILPAEKIIGKFNDMRIQIDHLVTLLEDVIEIGRGGAKRSEVTFTRFDVGAFCQRLLENARLLDRGAHQFVLDIQVRGEIEADERLLEHVFTNLLTNAMKYSPMGTTISMVILHNGEEWVFYIQDEGVGISAADLPHLFEPFHRAANVQDIQGTGLGLAIVKDYIGLHEGSVSVDSIVEQGTTFTIRLPRTAPRAGVSAKVN